jgi:DNA-binding NtrC family response regulator
LTKATPIRLKTIVLVEDENGLANEIKIELERQGYLVRTASIAQAADSARVGDTCACRKLNPGILVVQAAENWATKNLPGAIDGARDRCIFLQR